MTLRARAIQCGVAPIFSFESGNQHIFLYLEAAQSLCAVVRFDTEANCSATDDYFALAPESAGVFLILPMPLGVFPDRVSFP
jgi:hypothetical protein